jgi:hypothetical protein
MRTTPYIIRTLQKACVKHIDAIIDEVTYNSVGTYGSRFLLYLYSYKRLPTSKIREDIMSVTNAKSVTLDMDTSDSLISAVAKGPQNIPSQIYSTLSLRLPLTKSKTAFEIPFKCNIIRIEHGELDITVFLDDRTYRKELSIDNLRTDKMYESWKKLFKGLEIKEGNFI